MKMADLLRSLADKLDSEQNQADDQAQVAMEPVDAEIDQTDCDTADGNNFMPPLQQKLELLKKAVDVPNAFDKVNNSRPDELVAIRKNAGINPAVVHAASDDEPLE
jgi:hypothetical protein